MPCCGQKRAAVQRRTAAARARPEVTTPEPAAEEVVGPGETLLEYLGRAPVLVHGSQSGLLYAFSPGLRIRRVRNGDAEPLLQSPLFRPRAQEKRRRDGTRP
jgi:hypothetical protein